MVVTLHADYLAKRFIDRYAYRNYSRFPPPPELPVRHRPPITADEHARILEQYNRNARKPE